MAETKSYPKRTPEEWKAYYREKNRGKNEEKYRQEREDRQATWNIFKEEVRARGMEILPQIVQPYIDKGFEKIGPNEYKGCCPFHVENTASFTVSNKGYFCHGAACDAKGDVFDFARDKMGLSFKDAVLEIAAQVGMTPPEGVQPGARHNYVPKERPPEDPAAAYLADPERLGAHNLNIVPPSLWVPRPGRSVSLFREANEKKPEGVRRYSPEMVHEYRSVDNELKLIILRQRFSDGSKIFLPLRAEPPLPNTPDNLIKDGMSWHVRNTGNESRRPVYGAHNLRAWIADPNRGPILLVEGEKCADYANRAFPEDGTLILSASGGFNANILADWKELTDVMAAEGVVPKAFIVWPDNEPDRKFRDGTEVNTQELYAKQIFSGLLRDLWASFGNASIADEIAFRRVVPPSIETVGKGWDIADAMDEGWTRENLEAYMRAAIEVDLSHMKGHAPENAGLSDESPLLGA